jgi:hypothetical protein
MPLPQGASVIDIETVRRIYPQGTAALTTPVTRTITTGSFQPDQEHAGLRPRCGGTTGWELARGRWGGYPFCRQAPPRVRAEDVGLADPRALSVAASAALRPRTSLDFQ